MSPLYRGSLRESAALSRYLRDLGFDTGAAGAKAEMYAAGALALDAADSVGRKHAYYVPGRIEVLGKHTDYAGGSTMVAAIERAACLVASPRDDSLVTILDVVRNETTCFSMSPDLTPSAGHWSNYPMTVARRIARNFPGSRRGAAIAFSSDLPEAAGMSSSSAFMIAVFYALADANEIWTHASFPAQLSNPVDLAGYLACVENGESFGALGGDRGVGTFGGSEDHTAILCSRPGHISQYSYCPVRFEQAIPIPERHTFVIASSAVVARKTGQALEKYNRASRLARRLVELWQAATGRADPHLAAVLGSSPDALDRMRGLIAAKAADQSERNGLAGRLDHFVRENNFVIPSAAAALNRNNLEDFGAIVDSSQEAAEKLLRNQVPETSFLAAAARRRGAVAASAFGAGFGGSVWALVDAARASRFRDEWRDDYTVTFPTRAAGSEFFITAAGRPMFRIC